MANILIFLPKKSDEVFLMQKLLIFLHQKYQMYFKKYLSYNSEMCLSLTSLLGLRCFEHLGPVVQS